MKKLFTSLALILLVSIGFGQLTNIRIGGNATAGLTLTTATINGIDSEQDSSGVVATMIPVTVDFAPWKFISFGAGFKMGSWLNEDPEDNNIVIKQKRTSTFLLGLKLYPVLKENFHLYFGYDIGFGGFKTEKETTGFLIFTDFQKWGGTNQNINFGMNWYFNSAFGMYFQMGYTGFNFKLKEYTINNVNQLNNDAYDFSADMKVKGAQVELGFAYKLGQID